MAMILTEEQELLQQTAKEFLAEHAPVSHMRALRDSKDETGFSRTLWKEMAALGWAGITLPEIYGGSDLGLAELGVLFEECGRTLMPEPLLSTVVLGATPILLSGNDDQKQAILPGIAAGETFVALAFQESGRFAPYAIETRAQKSGSGFRLSGCKRFVLDGHIANPLIVAARTAGNSGDRDGISLFLVDPEAKGVKRTRSQLVDSRATAQIDLDDVEVGADALLGELGAGADVLDAVFDRASVLVSAELLGLATEAFERTIEYLKTREQFDVKIGSFQALKHRAALLFCELELSRSIVVDALHAIDEGREETPTLVSAAKARLSDTAGLVTRESLQMHGGIGMTDEEDIGLFLKRAKVAELFLGDAAYHRDRFATLQGF